MPGLAALAGEEVDDLVGSVDDGVAEAEHTGGALLDRERAPGLLRPVGPGDDLPHLVRGRDRRLAD